MRASGKKYLEQEGFTSSLQSEGFCSGPCKQILQCLVSGDFLDQAGKGRLQSVACVGYVADKQKHPLAQRIRLKPEVLNSTFVWLQASANLTENEWSALFRERQAWLERLEGRQFHPSFCR